MLPKLGATRLGVWAIKHVVAPLDLWLYQRTGGRIVSTGRPAGPLLLLTTIGRQSGKERTTPVFYLSKDDRLIVCNVNPGFERINPWVLNLRANSIAIVRVGTETYSCRAREATPAETEAYWPQLTSIWPAYAAHFERSGQRAVFVLEKSR